MPIPFRFIASGQCDAVTNMALDEFLFDEFTAGRSRPVFRIYGWKPASLSLGRSQDARTVDRTACDAHGVPVVRRMTGGGAIYHDNEITYSIAAAAADIGGSVKECYRFLCGFILSAYRELGLAPSFANELPHDGKFGERNPVCFAAREEYDIVVNGYKIGGNAQRWKRTHVFQHGSIPFSLSPDRYAALMRGATPGGNSRSLADHGIAIEFTTMADILMRSFTAACNAEYISRESIDSLPQEAAAYRDKYASARWTWDGKSAPE